ncbi:hypothetical protein OQJ15_02050 [Fluoribacter dumoffii]|uniref:hypothetical protein n=1 Tax=Fluoribacter dumoffii TaxID=463 RepID=UPI0022442A1B|nr:hypothetical protein [Fluoribacter dumoffii]MCW8385081.1 hypothetical protein [Fluoribacter dumoffii]MCW8496621.1 hypothetical protein [Fluoribacter dumoffii]
MRNYITNDNLAKISANYKCQNKGWVKSYLEIDVLSHEETDKFAVLIPNFSTHDISIEGALTWGKSGFSFELQSTILFTQVPLVSFQVHNDNCILTEEEIYDIIGFLLHCANEKVTTVPSEDYRGWHFKAPTLKALKRTINVTEKNRNNIQKHTGSGVFDPIFAKFLISHEKEGIRCFG